MTKANNIKASRKVSTKNSAVEIVVILTYSLSTDIGFEAFI